MFRLTGSCKRKFDGTALVSHGRAYQSLDYTAAVLGLSDGRDLTIPLETEDAHNDPPEPLRNDWLSDFLDADISQVEPFSIVVSRRPLEFDAPALEGTDNRVRIVSEALPSGRPSRAIYVVDVSGGVDAEVHRALLVGVRRDIERRELERRAFR